ncbi:2-hydroxychromene-2-carboxylate isomerase [Tabrizicola sp.]|uniref:2-hydroxychromene-2-carboxylate isomerase n=1 Tax=Tabrizicola sp. TaxID=2005166 RepID=UPI0025DDDB6F|nr:DsbA family protein [Tabrizicola sp.]
MGSLDFFYFFGSVYAYPSVLRIGPMAEKAGVQVRWRPINVRPLMRENNVALRDEAQKVRYMWRDIQRRAAWHGLPFVKPPIWPTEPDLLASHVAMVAATEGWVEAYSVESFRAWFLAGLPLGTPDSLAVILPRLGQEPERVLALAQDPAAAARLDAETDAARQVGAFGSPSFAVGGELFWGDDRLDEAVAWAAGTHPAQR